MAKFLVTEEDAVTGTAQHKTPCSDCPWARKSLNGWLGSATIDEWLQMANGETVISCHVISNMQCAGAAIYRRNVCKLPRPPNLVLEADREKVFASPSQFREHHSKSFDPT